jgi:hypothetical protein
MAHQHEEQHDNLLIFAIRRRKIQHLLNCKSTNVLANYEHTCLHDESQYY